MGIKVLISPPTMTKDAIDIAETSAIRTSVGISAAAVSPALENGFYDLWTDVNLHIAVGATVSVASAVTNLNGYLIRANTTRTLAVRQGNYVGAIAATSVGTVVLQKVWNADV